MKKYLLITSLALSAAAGSASGESVLVCGDPSVAGIGSEITIAQFIKGEDPIAPVVKSDHWRIQHKLINAPVCPAFEVEPSQKIYMRVQKPTGELHTKNQYSMYHLDWGQRPNYTGSYNLFLEMVPRSDNFYRWYRSPFIEVNGQVRESPTIGLNGTAEWAGMYPLRPGFEETKLSVDGMTIVIQ